MSTIPCPHCGGQVSAGRGIARRHIASCPHDPARYDAIKAALTDADGYATSHNLYTARAQRDGLPSVSAMRMAFGSWSAALAYFGLAMSPARQAHSATITARAHTVRHPRPNADDVRVGAEVDAAREEARRAEEEARDLHRGLQVCSARTLPGGGTAYVLR